ncbi:cadherin-23-like [Branchiostoma lanceolatum]|uniref:cadherin-23-like n=1 Tax=Branchiostoma lanceolatum TaxID=7740 RepID=UPI003455684B
MTGEQGLFAVTKKSNYEQAAVTITGNIDYETYLTFTLVITVKNSLGETTSATIYVNVQDENEAPTLNLNDVVTMTENSAVGTSVFDVICSDEDTTSPNMDTVLTHTDVDVSGFFDIAGTGAVTLSSSADLDYETRQQHTLTFTCTDGGTPALSATGTLNIQVTNVNEAPVITTPSSGSQIEAIDENTNPNTNVFQFVAGDDDSGDTQTWSIFSQTPNAQFVINSASGQVSTSSSPVLDYETNNQYVLVVHVVDSTSLTASATLTVNLNDVNEAPTFTVYPASDTVSVSEDQSGSFTIDTFTASDVEISTQTLTFSMTLDNTSPTTTTAIPFEFVKTSATQAILRTAAAPSIDFETVSQYDVTLTVSDDAGLSLSEDRTLSIYIQDVNEAPVITNTAASLIMSLDENQGGGAAVFTFTGSDEDRPGDILTWTMASQSPSSQFVIDAASGIVSTSASPTINYESAETQYLLTVELDDGTLTAAATLTVNVNDINEAPTMNLNAVVTMAENSAVGTSVFDVTCSDDDTTSPQSDTVLTHTDVDGSGFFDVASTGAVTLSSTANLDYENSQQHTLTFTCIDGGTTALSSTGTLDIQVTNVNEAPAITSPSSGSQIETINENTNPNTNVFQFVASDDDTGDTQAWSIFSQTPNAQFVINSASGQVSTSSSPVLDYETNNQYILVVHVVDSTSLTASATLTVNLNDVNEAPTFTVYPASDTVNVDENESGSVTIDTFTASDPEISTQTLTFSMALVSTTPPGGGTLPFEFVKTSATQAELRTAAAPTIDSEAFSQYDVTLTRH